MPLEKEPSGWLSGYHGYWFTDHYEIDKTMGGKEAYLKLVAAAHERGLKIIQDAVYNHIGAEHWIMKDLPDSRLDQLVAGISEYKSPRRGQFSIFMLPQKTGK